MTRIIGSYTEQVFRTWFGLYLLIHNPEYVGLAPFQRDALLDYHWNCFSATYNDGEKEGYGVRSSDMSNYGLVRKAE